MLKCKKKEQWSFLLPILHHMKILVLNHPRVSACQASMVLGRWVLLKRLRKAIKKVRFLLSFNVHKWRHVASLIGSPSRHQLSFNDTPGLLDCTGVEAFYDCETGSVPLSIRRTASDADDINQRAEIFIANFHRHIQMERQVSLQLRYTNGLERTSSV